MSLLSTIGKFIGLGAAPFTGGLSLIPAAISTGLDVAGGIAKGRAADRAQTDAYNQVADQNALDRYKYAADQARAQYNAAPNLLSRAMFGDVMSGMTPVSFGADGRLTGGISSNLFSDATKEAGRNMSADALKRMLSNNPLNLPDIPTATARQQPGTADKVLGYMGLGGSAIRGVRDAMKPPEKSVTLDDLARIFGGRGGGGTGTTTTSGQGGPTYGSGPMGDSGAMSYNPVSPKPGQYGFYSDDTTMNPSNLGIARNPRIMRPRP